MIIYSIYTQLIKIKLNDLTCNFHVLYLNTRLKIQNCIYCII